MSTTITHENPWYKTPGYQYDISDPMTKIVSIPFAGWFRDHAITRELVDGAWAYFILTPAGVMPAGRRSELQEALATFFSSDEVSQMIAEQAGIQDPGSRTPAPMGFRDHDRGPNVSGSFIAAVDFWHGSLDPARSPDHPRRIEITTPGYFPEVLIGPTETIELALARHLVKSHAAEFVRGVLNAWEDQPGRTLTFGEGPINPTIPEMARMGMYKDLKDQGATSDVS